jgi:predicted dehydrogenase
MLRLAVVGGGHLGRIHARLARQTHGVELVGVVDPDPQARQAVSDDGYAAPYAHVEDLPGDLDAAVIAVPTSLHHRVTMPLIARGVHVLVEKPLADSPADAEAIAQAARGAGVILQVGHVERFNPALSGVREHLGAVQFVDALRAGPYTFRSTDIGVVMDLMIHDIDVVLSLIDAPIERVEAIGTSVVGPREDLANARLTFATGAVANLTASRVSYEAVRRMWLVSADGFASVDFAAGRSTLVGVGDRLLEGSLDETSLSPADKQAIREEFFTTWLPMRRTDPEPTNAIAEELSEFADSIRTGRAPRVDGTAGSAAVAVAERIVHEIARHSKTRRPLRITPNASPGLSIHLPATAPRPDAATPHPRREAG